MNRCFAVALSVVVLAALGCGGAPRNETLSFPLTKGLEITRSSTDTAGDDAGYFTIFAGTGSLETWLARAKAELPVSQGWTYEVTRPKHISKD